MKVEAAAPLDPRALAAARVGVLGGSFDPPHRGHAHAARVAAEACDLDHVLFVPARRPPHKPGRALAAAEDRVAMLARLVAGEPRWSVWEGELRRGGPSYSVDTARELRRLGVRGLRWILGSDNLPGLPGWREAEELLRLAPPVVVVRRGEPLALGGPAFERLSAEARRLLAEGLVEAPPLDASSTELRSRLEAGEDPGEALPPAVGEYARERGIYRAP